MSSRTLARPLRAAATSATAPARLFSTTCMRPAEDLAPEAPRKDGSQPRWAYTPPAMKAPFSPHVTKFPERSQWKVNSNPAVLNDMYNKLLGKNGDRMLSEELKWLAVTHKTFDQGRRGLNDRLSYLGRMALNHECTKTIVTSPAKDPTVQADEFGRVPFDNAQLASLDNLSKEQPQHIISISNMERIGNEVGLPKVLRWKPHNPFNLVASGQTTVTVGALQAIFGALLLQHGSEVTSRLIRERILARARLA